MKQFLRNAFALTAMLLMSLSAKAGITEARGWFEAAPQTRRHTRRSTASSYSSIRDITVPTLSD